MRIFGSRSTLPSAASIEAAKSTRLFCAEPRRQGQGDRPNSSPLQDVVAVRLRGKLSEGRDRGQIGQFVKRTPATRAVIWASPPLLPSIIDERLYGRGQVCFRRVSAQRTCSAECRITNRKAVVPIGRRGGSPCPNTDSRCYTTSLRPDAPRCSAAHASRTVSNITIASYL